MPYLRSLLVLLLLSSVISAGDWPQWLGPKRNGTTSEKIAPWKGKLKILWRQPVGEGHSSPVVANGVVYLHTRDGKNEAEILQAFRADDGKKLWGTSYPRPAYKGLFGNGPRATPAVAGGKVYAFGITGILTCFDAKKGKQVWQVDTLKEFNAPKLFFGASCSPLIVGNKVLINVGAKGASIVAFDKNTGKVMWKALDDKASYSSPIAFGKGKERQIVFLTGAGLVSLAPKDGSVFWRFPFQDKLAESSTTPVHAGKFLIGSSITKGSVGLKLDNSGQQPDAKKVWLNPKLTCYFSTPIPVGKQLYMVTGTVPPAVFISATLRCVDVQTGKERWNKPNVGKYHASLLRTGDNKLLMLEEKGNLVLLNPSAKNYEELARSKICNSTWAHPAISNGRVYIRDRQELICVELPR